MLVARPRLEPSPMACALCIIGNENFFERFLHSMGGSVAKTAAFGKL